MDEQFELTVLYKGEQHLFNATLRVHGYSHRFYINVHGQEIIFEPDEERNYRAILNHAEVENTRDTDIHLLKKIAEAIEGIVK